MKISNLLAGSLAIASISTMTGLVVVAADDNKTTTTSGSEQAATNAGSTSSSAATSSSSATDSSTAAGSSTATTPPTATSKASDAGAGTAAAKPPGSTEESDEIKLPKNFLHSSTVVANSKCKITCRDPHAANDQAAEVINILQQIYKAYSDKDFAYIGDHLAPECITFYEGDKKVISGKEAALADIKEWTEKEALKTDSPMIEIVLDHPYCNVNGDHAVITFTAIKHIGGVHPGKSKSHVNDVFKKAGSSWELLTHYRSNWKEIN